MIGKALIALLIAYLFWYVQAFGNSRTVLYGATVLSVVCVFFHMVWKGSSIIQNFPLGIWINFIMVVYCVFTSVMVAKYTGAAISASITYMAYGMVCFVIAYIAIEENSIEWLIKIVIGIVFLCCFWVSFFGIELYGYGRVMGSNNNPNVLGVVMVLGIAALAIRSKESIKKTMVFLILSIWPLYTIVGCGSRKSLMAAGIFYLIWLSALTVRILCSKEKQGIYLYICILIIVGCIVVYYYSNYYLNTDMANRMSRFSDESSNSYRKELYQKAFQLFRENPIFGIGLDQFKYRSGTGGYSHSTYAEMLADFGIVGSAIYCIPIIDSVVIALKKVIRDINKYYFALIIALIGAELFLGVGQIFFFEFTHFIAWTIIYLYLFIEEPVNYLEKKPKSKSRYKYVKN